MLFTLEKGDMFEVSMASVECIVGKSNGITLLILKSGNVLSVPPEIASTKKLTKLWDANNIASVKPTSHAMQQICAYPKTKI